MAGVDTWSILISIEASVSIHLARETTSLYPSALAISEGYSLTTPAIYFAPFYVIRPTVNYMHSLLEESLRVVLWLK